MEHHARLAFVSPSCVVYIAGVPVGRLSLSVLKELDPTKAKSSTVVYEDNAGCPESETDANLLLRYKQNTAACKKRGEKPAPLVTITRNEVDELCFLVQKNVMTFLANAAVVANDGQQQLRELVNRLKFEIDSTQSVLYESFKKNVEIKVEGMGDGPEASVDRAAEKSGLHSNSYDIGEQFECMQDAVKEDKEPREGTPVKENNNNEEEPRSPVTPDFNKMLEENDSSREVAVKKEDVLFEVQLQSMYVVDLDNSNGTEGEETAHRNKLDDRKEDHREKAHEELKDGSEKRQESSEKKSDKKPKS